MTRLRTRAFTLVELLVVLAILAVVIALLLPHLSRSRQSAMQAMCGNQLRQIYMAAEQWHQDHDRKQKNLPAQGWRSELSQYLSQNSRVYVCPLKESAAEHSVSTAAVTAGRDRDMYLEPGPTVGRVELPNGGYQLWFEDRPGDTRFDGLGLSLANTRVGTTVTVVGKTTVRNYQLINTLSRTVIRDKLGDKDGLPEGASITLSLPAESYGVNPLWNEVRKLNTRVYMLDYDATVADPRDVSAWAAPGFARHMGQMNVLWADGSVRPTSPADINPQLNGNYARYWQP